MGTEAVRFLVLWMAGWIHSRQLEVIVLSIKSECLSKLVPLGENHLRRAVSEYVEHYHRERNHQGVGNRLLTPGEPAVLPANGNAPVERRERLGGLRSFYYRPAA